MPLPERVVPALPAHWTLWEITSQLAVVQDLQGATPAPSHLASTQTPAVGPLGLQWAGVQGCREVPPSSHTGSRSLARAHRGCGTARPPGALPLGPLLLSWPAGSYCREDPAPSNPLWYGTTCGGPALPPHGADLKGAWVLWAAGQGQWVGGPRGLVGEGARHYF